jgi:hypothetical protein
MRSERMATSAASLALAALLAAGLVPGPAAGQHEAPAGTRQASAKATCEFTHRAYSGKCTQSVDVAEGATANDACAIVLDCLNDVRCTKTYCGATSLRGGWKLESAVSGSEPSK